MALFDRYVAVDWSAANSPKRGADSIWIAEARRSEGRPAGGPVNPPTRSAAMAMLRDLFDNAAARRERVLAGFDFPFGYPAGATALLAGEPAWRALWRLFHDAVEDDDDNRSNRFALAANLNRDAFGERVYWGRPHRHQYRWLPARRADVGPLHRRLAFRHAEIAAPPAKSVWQLAYNGAVGSQAMLGLARLEGLRRELGDACAVWPFETSFADDLSRPFVLAEIYPSLTPIAPAPGEVRDSAQVRAVAAAMAAADAAGNLGAMLGQPRGFPEDALEAIRTEEGWILGVRTAQRRMAA